MVKSLFRTLGRNERPFLVLAAAALISVMACASARGPSHGSGHETHRIQGSPTWIPSIISHWRQRFLDAGRESDPEGLVRGVFLGDSPDVRPEIAESFRRAGLAHFLSADGYKCWFTAAALEILGAVLARLAGLALPGRLALGLLAATTTAARIGGAWLYWLWSAQSPAATRAALMLTERAALLSLGFPCSFQRLLLAQYLLSLALLPRLWWSAGFQLSYSSLVGIIFAAAWLQRRRFGSVLSRYFVTSSVIAAGAAIASIPASLAFFGEAPLTGVFTHWFAVPIVAGAMMPFGLIAMVLSHPGLPMTGAHAAFRVASGAGHILTCLISSWQQFFPDIGL